MAEENASNEGQKQVAPRQFDSVSARDFALAKLDAVELPGWRAGLMRQKLPAPTDLHQWAVGEAIYTGAVKNLLALRARVEFHMGKSINAVDDLVQKILVVGAQQLVHMPKVPPAVVVDQAVEQCRRFGRPRAAGMVNAVLRNFGRQVYPKPAAEEVERGMSFPFEAYQRFVTAIGKKRAKAIVEHANSEAPVTVRLGAGVKPQGLRDALPEGSEVKVIPHAQPGMVAVEGGTRAVFRQWAAAGLGQVQDPTAALVVKGLNLTKGLTVLDRCAGIGTKTLQIADAVGSEGLVVAVDPNKWRMGQLGELAKERGLGQVVTREGGWMRELEAMPAAVVEGGGFDRVLVDAPCSNSGVMARRAEARFHQTVGALKSLGKLQQAILADSASVVKRGGLMVYSTCSIWPEENEEAVRQFLSKTPGWNLLAEKMTDPDGAGEPARYRDGGYAAVLVRVE